MAQKRMFDKRIVGTDKFANLSSSAKALYFLAGMTADDRGFFQPLSLQRIHGFTNDDYKLLIAKGYFLVFESGVMVITDWNKNNWLDTRRVQETEYIEELKLLKIINDKYEYNFLINDDAKQMLSQNSIEENSIEENSIEYNNIVEQNSTTEPKGKEINEIIEFLNETTKQHYKLGTTKTRSLIKARLNEGFTIDDFKEVIKKKAFEWSGTDMEKYLRPETLFSNKFESYLNQKSKKITTNDITKTQVYKDFLKELGENMYE